MPEHDMVAGGLKLPSNNSDAELIRVDRTDLRRAFNRHEELRLRCAQLLAANNRLVEERRAAEAEVRRARTDAEALRLAYHSLRDTHSDAMGELQELCQRYMVPPGGLISRCLDQHLENLHRFEWLLSQFASPRPLEDYHEDFGTACWWKFPVVEPPYIGCPLSSDWPGVHTHWTPFGWFGNLVGSAWLDMVEPPQPGESSRFLTGLQEVAARMGYEPPKRGTPDAR